MHHITPIEIRQKSFERAFRGYNVEEVDAFLHSLAYVWEKLLLQLEEAEDSLHDTQKEVKRLHGIENAILRAAQESELAGGKIIEQAKKEAELHLRGADMEVAQRHHDAQNHLRKSEEEHARRLRLLEEQAHQKLEVAKKSIREAEAYRDTLLQKMRHLAEDLLARTQMIQTAPALETARAPVTTGDASPSQVLEEGPSQDRL